jgi:transcription elongation factor GreA
MIDRSASKSSLAYTILIIPNGKREPTMVDKQPIYLTAEGATKLAAELKDLKGPQRLAISKRLRDAIQMGDLSENADYHKAKEDQGFLEGRIQELEYMFRNAIIVEKTGVPKDIVSIGGHVTVQENGSDPETYHMVGAKEADPRIGKISHESPIGLALMDHHVGDVVDVITPGGRIKLRILKIE